MSKRAKDIKKCIFDEATKLFCSRDYDDVEMRQIARECGIAVGTLYNYYPNKKELYLSIIEASWQHTFKSLNKIDELKIPLKEKIKKYIKTLYEDVESRKGLSNALFKSNFGELSGDMRICQVKENIMENVIDLISKVDKKPEFAHDAHINSKIAETLLVTMVILIDVHSKEKEANIKFLYQLVRGFIQN